MKFWIYPIIPFVKNDLKLIKKLPNKLINLEFAWNTDYWDRVPNLFKHGNDFKVKPLNLGRNASRKILTVPLSRRLQNPMPTRYCVVLCPRSDFICTVRSRLLIWRFRLPEHEKAKTEGNFWLFLHWTLSTIHFCYFKLPRPIRRVTDISSTGQQWYHFSRHLALPFITTFL